MYKFHSQIQKILAGKVDTNQKYGQKLKPTVSFQCNHYIYGRFADAAVQS